MSWEGKVTCSRGLGSLLCRDMAGGVEKASVGFSNEAEQSQLLAANVPPLPSLWMRDLGCLCCTSVLSRPSSHGSVTSHSRTALRQALCDLQGLEEQPTHSQPGSAVLIAGSQR